MAGADDTPQRCRLVLATPPQGTPEALARAVESALGAGDVASLILPQYDMDDVGFQVLAEALVPIAQARGVAVVIAGDSRVAGRVKADGIHVEGSASELADAIERQGGRIMVGAGGAKTRDDALELGEAQPDYIFFGRFGYDNQPEAHPRNLSLGGWWAEMIEIPCIVMAGSEVASLTAVAATGAEFALLSHAVFGEGRDPAQAVAAANALLDEHARGVVEA
jgi:thiamine-phosphate pyrophosphorylase